MKVPASILSFILMMGFTYLMSAFIGNSFNIGDWNSDGRFFCVMFALIFGCAGFALTYVEMEKSK